MLLIKSEPFLGPFDGIGVAARLVDRLFLELDRLLEIARLGISGSQSIDVIPAIPRVDMTSRIGIGHGLFAIAKGRVGTSRIDPGAVRASQGVGMEARVEGDDLIELAIALSYCPVSR